MDQQKPKYFVVGLTHIDLAWKKDREEHQELMESAVLRLLDVLDNHPCYTYTLEQAAHYHTLSKTRPDLIARLRDYLHQGRLEFVGGLASTLETNGPSGESYVRNQLLGLRCVHDLFGVTVRTGYLIDTFGVNAQVPQIMRQFDLKGLLANRFGGILNEDIFVSLGLDGTRILVAGRDVYSPFVAWDRVFFGHVQDNKQIKRLIDRAATAEGEGPFLVMPYTEYDGIASSYIDKLVNENNAAGNDKKWAFAKLSDFFDALHDQDACWPERNGDLNPEFTGTFGLRVAIRCLHRTSETLLLESEKWATLLKMSGWEDETRELWWKMAFVQSHDVYSGSHPTSVYQEAIAQLEDVAQGAHDLLLRSAGRSATSGAVEEVGFVAMNGLPWLRDAVVSVTLPETVDPATVTGVQHMGKQVSFDIEGDLLSFRTLFSGVSASQILLSCAGSAADSRLANPARLVSRAEIEPSAVARIENEFVSVTGDRSLGLLLHVKDPVGETTRPIRVEIVLQEDRGSFQIESLVRAEVSSLVGIEDVDGPELSQLRKRISIRGRFPTLWMKEPSPLEWELEATLYPGKPSVDLAIRLNWSGEASRVRLKVSTEFETSTGIFEIPFGAVKRMPYHSRATARGEWPAHRWVAIEENDSGVALINRGHLGAEVSGGVIWATLLRAPVSEYAGMIADETSSQHGRHDFRFSLLPYRGSWTDGKVIEAGQEVNSPVHCFVLPAGSTASDRSFLSLEPSTVVLSGIKLPEDDTADELIVRVYEAIGQHTQAYLHMKGAQSAWHSDLREVRGDSAECLEERISINLAPFEIKTLRIRRA